MDVALIDTGIAPVPGLTGPGKVINGPDLSFESQDPSRRYVDNNGHGTHMAGIIAASDVWGSSRAVDAGPAAIEGVAPGARLVNVKVGDGNGVTDVSQVLAAIDWVVQHAHDPNGAPGGLNIRVLNLSYGTDSPQSATIDPLAHAAEVAWRSGIVVVAAAGNDGSTTGRLADPAIDPYLIAVGAADTGDGHRAFRLHDPDLLQPRQRRAQPRRGRSGRAHREPDRARVGGCRGLWCGRGRRHAADPGKRHVAGDRHGERGGGAAALGPSERSARTGSRRCSCAPPKPSAAPVRVTKAPGSSTWLGRKGPASATRRKPSRSPPEAARSTGPAGRTS